MVSQAIGGKAFLNCIPLLITKTTWYFIKKGLPLCKKKAWKLWRKHVEVKQF